MDWSFQLYSARKFGPWPATLELLARLGYAEVEGFGGVYEDVAGLRRAMDANGLKMPTGHFALDALEGNLDGVRRIADALGVRTLVCPYLLTEQRPADAAGWTRFGERLGRIAGKVAAAGYGFAWHNHDFEFEPLADGSVPQRLILEAAPSLGLELDVAWIVRGGADPLPWIREYGPRIQAVHVKDIAPAGENAEEDGWADVGQGVLDWPRLMRALRDAAPAKTYVVEHDNPADLERFAGRSIDFVRSLRGAA
jgi:sugar phosphate isomerase/epimerase